MPLNGHTHLVKQGWTGTGTGLRPGAMSRPLTIPQKRTLAGVGKDRDEAFPFWDHLYSAAANAIRINVLSDEEDSDEDDSVTPTTELRRTSTGILSTRRPVAGTPATSGTTTPASAGSDASSSRLSLMSIAKREAAKRGLYSRFFRGPIIGPDDVETEMVMSEIVATAVQPHDAVPKKTAKRKGKERETDVSVAGADDLAKAERKRQRKEAKEAEKRERKERKKERRKSVQASDDENEDAADTGMPSFMAVKKTKTMEEKEGSRKKRKVDAIAEVSGAPPVKKKKKRKQETLPEHIL
ncbi:hypothetical protein FA95DRAFT_1553357 [Auriscalpium vulgare]|uniref:Uncharacterized protein n=1 Tax=Auriscalpium vulgare TaxID=40419 RepID=A0ACB8S895_9AGAM|nr:hypothetical protein FA95DRAFT_1553357 [Auriscalpium vulgare]